MSWFSSRAPQLPNGLAGAGSAPKAGAALATLEPGAEPEVHSSLALATLFREVGPLGKLQILDLGPAVGSNVEFLSHFGCKLYIEDLYAALAAHRRQEDRQVASAAPFAELLPFPESARFDAVFAWDLFNYLSRKELAGLAHYLKPFCRPGALVFALVSILKQMPAAPIRFKILDRDRLAYERQTADESPCPRYPPAELADLMKGFRLDRSFLLRHGIQENLFTRLPD
jgi:SAM-dependent methyltransferase